MNGSLGERKKSSSTGPGGRLPVCILINQLNERRQINQGDHSISCVDDRRGLRRHCGEFKRINEFFVACLDSSISHSTSLKPLNTTMTQLH